ncbi:MAG: Zn-ribbon domain-containing OB-fold protein [Dehalococcoidia bacterium]
MTAESRPPFPPPVPTEDNQPFWDALREGRLVVQECEVCGGLVHPPRPMCPECGAFEKTWREMSGRGEVFSYVVTHQAIHPSFTGHTPCATVLVRLEEGPLVTTNLTDVAHDEIAIGMPVRADFIAISDEVTLPLFRRG